MSAASELVGLTRDLLAEVRKMRKSLDGVAAQAGRDIGELKQRVTTLEENEKHTRSKPAPRPRPAVVR